MSCALVMPRKKPTEWKRPEPEWKQRLRAKEQKRRQRVPKVVRQLLADLFPAQRKFANDPARIVAAHPGRRAGKTYGVCARLTIDALSNPGKGIVIPYVHKTLTSGSSNMGWNTLLEIGSRYGLGLKIRTNPLRKITYPGGCSIWFVGADKEDQIEKLRGDAYPAAYIDEAGTYRPRLLTKLIEDVLSPALVEHEGAIVMVGTPSYVAKGPFYESIFLPEYESSVHHWTMLDNPHIPNAKAEMEKILKRRAWDETHPVFRREYLGQWVFEKKGLVYHGFDTRRNLFDGELENNEPKRWRYILGIDYGFRAPTAFAVLAYDTQLPRVRILRCYEMDRLLHTGVATEVLKLQKQFNFDTVVVDAAHPELIEAIKRRGGINVIGSEKKDKMGFIEVMNDEYRTGIIQLNERSCQSLVEQYKTLPLSDRSNQARLVEDNKHFPNHSCHVPGTLVCANGGRFLPIETLQPGDTVLTHKGQWRRINHVLSRSYEGKVINVNASGTEPVLSTPEHEYVEHTYVRSYDGALTGQARATGETSRTRADNLLGKSLHYGVSNKASTGDVLQSFVDGYYLAEGSSSLKAGTVQFAGHAQETRVEALVSDWAVSIRTRKQWAVNHVHKGNGKGKGRVLSVYNMAATKRYQTFGKGIGKHHPELNTTDFQACLEGYFHGDGHMSPDGIKASSISRELAYQVAFMARSLGYKVSVCKLRRAGRYGGFGPDGKVANDSWQVSLSKLSSLRFVENSHWPELWQDKTSHEIRTKYSREQAPKRARVSSTEQQDYAGPVYTLEVEGDHTYTVNGLETYNCDAALYGWRECRHYYAELERIPTKNERVAAEEKAWLESLQARHSGKNRWWNDKSGYRTPPAGLFTDRPWWAD